jgi:hypothetical protein
MFLLPYLDPDLMLINGRISRATMLEGRVELRDSYSIIPIALREIEKDEIDYNYFNVCERDKHRPEILKYLQKDCVELFNLVDNFINRFGFNMTLAGTAFKEIKKTGYEIGRCSEQYDEFFRQFYFGGRVQCFEVGKFEGKFDFVDINSAYPFSMTHRHWYGNGYLEKLKLPDPSKNGSWFADIEAVSHGALPIRSDKLYFPGDDTVRNYKASGWEINTALELGALKIKKVNRVYVPTLLNDFSVYIEKYYKEKATAKERGLEIKQNRIDYIFAKLLQNSGYGKFAQDPRKFKEYKILPLGEWPDGDEWEYVSDSEAGFTFFEKAAPGHVYFNVCTAASITAFVRAYLFKAIKQCKRPIYCDTDSLICEKFAGEIGNELGQWSREFTIEEGYVAGRKMYAVRGGDKIKTASKGVRLSFDEIKTGVLTKTNKKYYKDAPTYSVRQYENSDLFGARYSDGRIVDFENIEKNTLQNF